MKNYNTQDDVLLRKHKEKAGVRRIVEHEISNTVVENRQKKSHSTLRAKRATFTFSVAKSSLKIPKWSILAIF